VAFAFKLPEGSDAFEFVKMEKTFTYYYKASKLSLGDLQNIKERMDDIYRDFPHADVA
jgi:hypothetical protein